MRTHQAREPSRTRRGSGVLALLAVVAASWMGPGAEPVSGGEAFSVISVNLGRGGTNAYLESTGVKIGATAACDHMAALLRALVGSDRTLIGLQQVDEGTARSNNLEETKHLRDRLASGANGWNHAFAKILNFDGGQYGNSIITDVAQPTGVESRLLAFDPASTDYDDYGREQRGLMFSKQEFAGGRRLWFVNTHLDQHAPDKVAPRQLFELLRYIKAFDPDFPVLLVGTFVIEFGYSPGFARLSALLGYEDPGVSGFRSIIDSRGSYIFLYDPLDELQVLSEAAVPARFPLSNNPSDTVVLSAADVLLARLRWKN